MQRSEDDIDEPARHDDEFFHRLALDEGTDEVASQNKGLNIFAAHILSDHELAFDLAVDLDGVFRLFQNEGALVADGIALVKDGIFSAPLLPELFRKVRGEGGDEEDEVFEAFFEEGHVFVFRAVVLIESVDVFHQPRHGGIEGERLHVAGDLFDGIVAHEIQFLFRSAHAAFFSLFRQPFEDDAFRPVQELGDRFDAVVAPRAAFGIGKSEHQVHTEDVRAVYGDIFVGGDDVALGFGHPVAVGAEDDALVHEGAERFVKVQIPHIAQRFGEETRV